MRRITAVAVLLTALFTLSLIVAAAATAPSAEYQRRTPEARTPMAGGGGRSGDGVATAQAGATHAAATISAGATNVASTVQAGGANIEATVQAGATNIAATVQSIATSANLDVQALGGTATAVAGSWQAFLGSIDPEVAAALEALIANNSVVYDSATQSLIVTAYFDEAAANTLLDASMSAAGYDPASVSVNITSSDVQVSVVEGQTTTVFAYQVSVVNGEVVWTLVSVTVNGRSVPLETVPADVQAELAAGLEAALIDAELAATLATLNEFYAVETVTLTETGAVVVVRVPLTVD